MPDICLDKEEKREELLDNNTDIKSLERRMRNGSAEDTLFEITSLLLPEFL